MQAQKLNQSGATMLETVITMLIISMLVLVSLASMIGLVPGSKTRVCSISRLEMQHFYRTSVIAVDPQVSSQAFKIFVESKWGEKSPCPEGGIYTYWTNKSLDKKIELKILCSKHISLSDNLAILMHDWESLAGASLIYQQDGTEFPSAWNIQLEKILTNNDTGINSYGLQNPVAVAIGTVKGKAIVNKRTMNLPKAFWHPVVFITNNASCNYSAINSYNYLQRLTGSLIFYKADNSKTIECFYLDETGKKGTLHSFRMN
ncbi:MAG: hypothetical protein WCI30_00650 [Clostridia bacterium]